MSHRAIASSAVDVTVPSAMIVSISGVSSGLNPRFINGPYVNMLGLSGFLAGDHVEAIDVFEERVGRDGPVGPPALAVMGGEYEGLGNHDRARGLTASAVSQLPTFRLTTWNWLPLIRRTHQRERARDLIRMAGIPE